MRSLKLTRGGRSIQLVRHAREHLHQVWQIRVNLRSGKDGFGFNHRENASQ